MYTVRVYIPLSFSIVSCYWLLVRLYGIAETVNSACHNDVHYMLYCTHMAHMDHKCSGCIGGHSGDGDNDDSDGVDDAHKSVHTQTHRHRLRRDQNVRISFYSFCHSGIGHFVPCDMDTIPFVPFFLHTISMCVFFLYSSIKCSHYFMFYFWF